jgi:cation:H+ antiporter
MFDHLSNFPLLGIFAAAAAAVWVAGIYLARTTDALSKRLHLGQALGGIIMLAIVTNLPEIAITVSAALSGQVAVAVGNILGGIAIQTVVLVALDAFGLGRQNALTYQVASLVPALEATLVIAMLATAVMGSQLPATLLLGRVAPAGLLLLGLWALGLWLIGQARQGLPWQPKNAPDNQQKDDKSQDKKQKDKVLRTVLVFGASALVTLAAGVVLERSGEVLAGHIGIGGAVFGATVLAAATSLPELSTGLASIKQKHYELAIGDIFGGNAFLPVLLLVAGIISGKAVLPLASKLDVYLTGLGVLLTSIYLFGLITRPKRQVARMGLDSLAVLLLYALGVLGILAIGNH